jgi:hypothetical protein
MYNGYASDINWGDYMKFGYGEQPIDESRGKQFLQSGYELDNRPRYINVDDRDFGTILNCAVRYAIGRQTYMPHLVVEFIRPLLPHLCNAALAVLDQDITEARYEGGYGDPAIDEPMWLSFLREVRAERIRRDQAPYHSWHEEDEPQALCTVCLDKHPYRTEQSQQTSTVRNVTFSYLERRAYCTVCGNEIYVPEVNDANVESRERAYAAASQAVIAGHGED